MDKHQYIQLKHVWWNSWICHPGNIVWMKCMFYTEQESNCSACLMLPNFSVYNKIQLLDSYRLFLILGCYIYSYCKTMSLNHCVIGLKIKASASCYKTSSAMKKISTKLISNFKNKELKCLFWKWTILVIDRDLLLQFVRTTKIIFGKYLLPDKCIAVICLTFTQHTKNQNGLNCNLRCCKECCTPISTSSSWNIPYEYTNIL